MRVVLVGGIANKQFIKTLAPQKDIIFTNTFATINDLIDEVYNTGITFLNTVDSIVILDYGFRETDTFKRIELFVELQDVLKSSELRMTKLYLITKNSDMYTGLSNNVNGIPGILYINTEVMLIETDYQIKVLSEIIRGVRDQFGLYHPDVNKQDYQSRLEQDRDRFIEESRAVDSEILTYGTDEPISVLSSNDYIDSKYTEKQVLDRKKEERRRIQQEKVEQNRRRKQRRTSRQPMEDVESHRKELERDYEEDEDDSIELTLTDHSPRRPTQPENRELKTVTDEYGIENLHGNLDVDTHMISDENTGFGEEVSTDGSRWKSTANIRRLKEEVDNKRRTGMVVTDKVKNDTGIIGVFGDRQSGVSGIVANLAEVYGTSDRRVLVIDLDMLNRQQSAYFPNYEVHSQEFKGLGNGLITSIKGGNVSSSSVDITSRISLLGMSRNEPFTKDNQTLVNENLHSVLNEAVSEYDIVILDIPHYCTLELLEELQDIVQAFIMVTSDLLYRNDIYFNHVLQGYVKHNIKLMDKVFKKTKIIVNRINRNHILSNEKRHSNSDFGKWVTSLQFPYDRLYMLGEIPHYDDWESQYSTNIRFVWQDTNLMYMYADILNKIILD